MTMGSTKRLYGFPDMGRTGLGHSLLAWGRCAVWCRETGAIMLAPRWLRPRSGFLGKRRAGNAKIGPIKIKGQRKTDLPADFIAQLRAAGLAPGH